MKPFHFKSLPQRGLAAMLLFGSLPACSATVEVEIFKMQFAPQELTINKGDTVVWTNKEKRQYHSVWFTQWFEEEPEYFWPEESFQQRFDNVGSFSYRCGPHPKMTGTVHVK